MNSIFTKYGGRRFLMCMGCAMVCTVLVWFGKISGAEFAAIILGTVAAYVTGNTIQHNTETKHDSNPNQQNQSSD